MQNRIFNTPFENMLRVLLLIDSIGERMNIDRIVALDFISIYGRKFEILEKNLHGDNEFGFAEFANKRERITEAVALAVKNDYLSVDKTSDGFLFSINERGKEIVKNIESDYSRAYVIGTKIVYRRFANSSDEDILKFINKKASTGLEN